MLYYFSSNKEEDLIEKCNTLKNDTQNLLKEYINSCDNKILLEKYKSINYQISNLPTDNISKESLQKYLLLAKLKEELLGEE